MSAAPEPVHQRASRRLANLLEAATAQAGVNVEVLEAVNVIIPGGRLCVPDIALIDRSLADDTTKRFQPGSVLAVVKIPLNTAPAGARTTITQPFPIEVDPADLTTWS